MAVSSGVHVLLGPTINTQRSPLAGRGFESFAEDPHLNGTIATAYINGLQDTGVAATVKHFVAHDQEYQRCADVQLGPISSVVELVYADSQLVVR